MKLINTALAILFLFVTLFTFPPQAAAQEETTGDYLYAIGTKFGRGLVNVITSPAEIPCSMSLEMMDHTYQGFFTGFGKGSWYMVRRLLVGVTEVGTFMIPMEANLPPVCSEREALISEG